MSSSLVLPFPSCPHAVTTPLAPRPLGAKVALVVRDLDRAVDFWCGALGLELRLRLGDSWAEVATRGFMVGLLRDPEAAPSSWSSTTPTIALDVDDLERAVARVRARGVTVADFDSTRDLAQEVRYIRDPDGHRVALCELRLGPTVVPEWYGS